MNKKLGRSLVFHIVMLSLNLSLGRAKFCFPASSAVIQDNRGNIFHTSVERLQAGGADSPVSVSDER
jgi:hypothetical protein